MIEDNPNESYFKLEDKESRISIYDLSSYDLGNFMSDKLPLIQKNPNSESIFDIKARLNENMDALRFHLREKARARMLLLQSFKDIIDDIYSFQKVDGKENEANKILQYITSL